MSWTILRFPGALIICCPIAGYLFIYFVSQLVKSTKVYWLPTPCQATMWTLSFCWDIIAHIQTPVNSACQVPDSGNHFFLDSPVLLQIGPLRYWYYITFTISLWALNLKIWPPILRRTFIARLSWVLTIITFIVYLNVFIYIFLF